MVCPDADGHAGGGPVTKVWGAIKDLVLLALVGVVVWFTIRMHKLRNQETAIEFVHLAEKRRKVELKEAERKAAIEKKLQELEQAEATAVMQRWKEKFHRAN